LGLKKTAVKQEGCFSPNSGVFQGADWDNNGGAFNGQLTINAKGNDMYVGLFRDSTSSAFAYALIICGWNNAETHLYKDNSFATAISGVASSVDPNALNVYQISVTTDGTFSLSINGTNVMTYKDSDYTGNLSHVRYSQYGSNVEICPAGPALTCFVPKNEAYGSGHWENNGGAVTNGNLKFNAYGNDIYVAFFNDSNSESFVYAIIIAGWNNSETHLYAGNTFTPAIAGSSTTVDPEKLNSYELNFDNNSHDITLQVNGNQVFSYNDPNYNGNGLSYNRYSQYGTNAKICVPAAGSAPEEC